LLVKSVCDVNPLHAL